MGQHLRRRRLDLGLTQRAVAAKIGVITSTVFNWERGATEPDLRAIPAVLRFLGGDPRPFPSSLGDQIRRLREARGLSTRELAGEVGVDPSTVEKWERLGFNPHPRLYARLAELLGIPEPPESTPVGQRLRARRLALGLTQEEAGHILGVCQDVVSRWESGRSVPATRVLQQLCQAVDVGASGRKQ